MLGAAEECAVWQVRAAAAAAAAGGGADS